MTYTDKQLRSIHFPGMFHLKVVATRQDLHNNEISNIRSAQFIKRRVNQCLCGGSSTSTQRLKPGQWWYLPLKVSVCFQQARWRWLLATRQWHFICSLMTWPNLLRWFRFQLTGRRSNSHISIFLNWAVITHRLITGCRQIVSESNVWQIVVCDCVQWLPNFQRSPWQQSVSAGA